MAENKLLLFVVETTETCKSDEYYLTYLIKKSGLFEANSWKEASLQFVYLSGKTNYNSEEVVKDIDDKWNAYPSRNKHLFFVFDYDRDKKRDKEINEEIISYCSTFKTENEIIWFKKDIESVIVGKIVKDNEKNKTATDFYNKGKLDKSKTKLLQITKNKVFKSSSESNVLSVLSKYLKTEKKYSETVEKCVKANIDEENEIKEGKKSKKKVALQNRNKSKKY